MTLLGRTIKYSALHSDVAGEISALTEQTYVQSSDPLIFEGNLVAYAKRRLLCGNLPGAHLQTTFTLASGTNNNVLPAVDNLTWERTALLRLTAPAAAMVTGIVPCNIYSSLYPHVKKVCNPGSFDITFAYNNGSSLAENRLVTPTSASIVLGPNDVADFSYDTTTQRWRIG